MAKIPRLVIDQLRASITLSEIFERAAADAGVSVRLIKRGRGFVCLCPFHNEKTPSCNIINHKGIFHCFGCGEGGDVFALVQKLGAVHSFRDSIQYVAEITGQEALLGAYSSPGRSSVRKKGPKLAIELVEEGFDLDSPERDKLLSVVAFAQGYFEEQLHTNTYPGADLARAYLTGRGIHGDFARRLGLGYAPPHDLLLLRMQEEFGGFSPEEVYDLSRRVGLYTGQNRRVFSGRITFPIATRSGKVLAFNSRRLTEAKHSPKYKNSPQGIVFHKGEILLGLEHLCEEDVEKNGLVLVEGQTDLFGFLEQGLGNALTLGSTTLTEEHMGIIAALHPPVVYIMTDGDTAGIKGAIRNANRYVGTKGGTLPPVYIVPVVGRGKDPFDLFYREKRPILAYLLEHRQVPGDFVLSQEDEDLILDGQENLSYEFLRRNTGHIVRDGLLKQRFGSIERVLEAYEVTEPHPFLLEKPVKKGPAPVVKDITSFTGEQLAFKW